MAAEMVIAERKPYFDPIHTELMDFLYGFYYVGSGKMFEPSRKEVTMYAIEMDRENTPAYRFFAQGKFELSKLQRYRAYHHGREFVWARGLR